MGFWTSILFIFWVRFIELVKHIKDGRGAAFTKISHRSLTSASMVTLLIILKEQPRLPKSLLFFARADALFLVFAVPYRRASVFESSLKGCVPCSNDAHLHSPTPTTTASHGWQAPGQQQLTHLTLLRIRVFKSILGCLVGGDS